MRVWSTSGYQVANPVAIKIWKDQDSEPAETFSELVLERADLKKAARAIAKTWAESQNLDVGEYIVHIKSVDTGRIIDVPIKVETQTLVSWG